MTTPLDQASNSSGSPAVVAADAVSSQTGGAQVHVSTRTPSTSLATSSHADPMVAGPSAVYSPQQVVGQGAVSSGSGGGGGGGVGGEQKSPFAPQQGFSGAIGSRGVPAVRSDGGMMIGPHSTSAAVTTTPSPLSSALNIVSHDVSHDQDDSVFSPSSLSSVDDERMKFIEQVRDNLEQSRTWGVHPKGGGNCSWRRTHRSSV